MDGYRSTETSRARRPRIGLLIAMVALGLLAGIALTIAAVQRVRWFGAPAATNAAAAVRTGNSDFQPAQPLGPGDTAATPTPADPALLATREATLAAQLTRLEVRTATVSEDAVAAGGEAARAESVLAAAAARRAIDRGTALGYLEEQLRVRFGQSQPRAVAIVLQASRAPVTLDDLRQGLDGIGADLATGRSDVHWSDSLDRLFANLVVLRRAGTPSPLPVDRLARARRLLDGGQVDAARGEVAGLPGAGPAANWMTAARRYVLVRQALDAIDNAAILGQPVAATPRAAAKPGPATGPQGATAAVPPMAAR
ncbi:hypothetical protein [uncultured Sphingomonas sp.]|uniref:hypothetical protein n=1 Tax=uncultured Sphingomonas sp. TaxID=158754 RepID=UPI0035CAB19A